MLRVARGFDAADPFSRREPAPAARCRAAFAGCRFGVPRARPARILRQPRRRAAVSARRSRGSSSSGGEAVEVDFAPFLETARLLYEGPWVAERYAAIREFIERSRRRCIR